VTSAAVDHAVESLLRAPDPLDGAMAQAPIARVRADRPLSPAPDSLAAALAGGQTSSVELTRQAVGRAAQWPSVITDLDEAAGRALECAAELDRRRSRGESVGVLGGLPVLVKDNVDVAGLVSGQGGKLGRHRAGADSAVWSRLHAQGALPLGHTAMHELAWGLTTPGCPNPWGAGRTPGGSSGGAAASVAAGVVAFSVGTDTGGSVRVPAALCGVAGLRPTHGLSAMRGVAPLAPSLDTVGILAGTAAESVWAHELLCGPGTAAPDSIAGLRVGVLTGWQKRVAPGVAAAIEAGCSALRRHGVQLVELELPQARLAPSIAYVLMLIESSRLWLAEAEQGCTDVGTEVLGQLREGGRIDARDGVYERALQLARALRVQVEQALRANALAALLSPVTAVTGLPADASFVLVRDREMSSVDALSRYTGLASTTGLPALSVPVGLDAGFPVGVQFLGAAYDERLLALLARPVEQGPGRVVAVRRSRLPPFPENP